jgi:hypothetical protein
LQHNGIFGGFPVYRHPMGVSTVSGGMDNQGQFPCLFRPAGDAGAQLPLIGMPTPRAAVVV